MSQIIEFLAEQNQYALIVGSLVVVYVTSMVYSSISKNSRQLDGSDFDSVSSSFRILSNKDSALKEEKVEGCINEYILHDSHHFPFIMFLLIDTMTCFLVLEPVKPPTTIRLILEKMSTRRWLILFIILVF